MENLSINEIWANLIKKLENEIGKDLCDMWLKPMKIISFEGGVFKIEIPSTVWLQPVKDRYEILITQYLTELLQTIHFPGKGRGSAQTNIASFFFSKEKRGFLFKE